MKVIWTAIKYLFKIAVFILIVDVATILAFANIHPKLQKADAIIILGAAINSPALYNRSIKALELYNKDYAPVMILSGGRISDKDITEATYMERVMDQANAKKHPHPNPLPGGEEESVKPLNLVLEQDSHSTYENFINSKAEYPSAKNIIIVTDTYHIARSFFMAKKAGYKSVLWSAPARGEETFSDTFYHYFRETFALLAYIPKFIK